jgi:hypothetical protein
LLGNSLTEASALDGADESLKIIRQADYRHACFALVLHVTVALSCSQTNRPSKRQQLLVQPPEMEQHENAGFYGSLN